MYLELTKAERRKIATDAFRQFAARGQNTQQVEMLYTDTWLSDMAVKQTFSVLKILDKQIVIEAVAAVYFVDPFVPLQKNDIEYRVTKFCMSKHVCRTSVYNWLAFARNTYLSIRYPNDNRGAN